jgi:hypothetical protein
MRVVKRLAVAGVVAILAAGMAPANPANSAGGKVSSDAIICCKG